MSMNFLSIEKKAFLFAIQNHIPGEVVYCEDTKETFVWDEDKGWLPINNSDTPNEMGLNLYDLNKSIINQMTPLAKEVIRLKLKEVMSIYTTANSDSVFNMLLCKEYNYYTIFQKIPTIVNYNLKKAIYETITELGEVFSIEIVNGNQCEIWIRPVGEEDVKVFYLFPYDTGVITHG